MARKHGDRSSTWFLKYPKKKKNFEPRRTRRTRRREEKEEGEEGEEKTTNLHKSTRIPERTPFVLAGLSGVPTTDMLIILDSYS